MIADSPFIIVLAWTTGRSLRIDDAFSLSLLGPFSFGQYIYILGEKERSALPSALRPDYPDEAKRTDHQALMAEDGGFTFHHEL